LSFEAPTSSSGEELNAIAQEHSEAITGYLQDYAKYVDWQLVHRPSVEGGSDDYPKSMTLPRYVDPQTSETRGPTEQQAVAVAKELGAGITGARLPPTPVTPTSGTSSPIAKGTLTLKQVTATGRAIAQRAREVSKRAVEVRKHFLQAAWNSASPELRQQWRESVRRRQ
jgi:hypothetical protein